MLGAPPKGCPSKKALKLIGRVSPMQDSLKVWWSRIGISSIPVFLTLATILFGNPVINALGEGYSTFLYLVVILSTEIVIVLPLQRDESPGDRSLNVMLLLFVVVMWAAFVFTRVFLESPGGGLPLLVMFLLAIMSVFPAYFVAKKHHENAAYLNVSGEVLRNEEASVTKLEESKPVEAIVGGEKIAV
jgi:hypothetical protein